SLATWVRGRLEERQQRVPGDRLRPGGGHRAGHVPRPHAAGALDRGPARPLELVALPADGPSRLAGPDRAERRDRTARSGLPGAQRKERVMTRTRFILPSPRGRYLWRRSHAARA